MNPVRTTPRPPASSGLRPLLPLVLAALGAAPGAAEAQPTDAQRDAFAPFLIPTAEETALARSAAPASVSDAADLYLLGQEGYERISLGTNGFACLVERAWHDAATRAPICYNPAAVDAVLPVRLFEARMAARGATPPEIVDAMRRGFATGRFHPPGPGAFAYMMSEGQHLGTAGRAFPHVMMYTPYITNEEAGGHPSGSTMPTVLERPGEPSAILTIGTPDFQPVREWDGDLEPIGPAQEAALLRQLDANEAYLRSLTANLTDEEWTSRPDADSWSAAETLEHIVAAEIALLGQVMTAVASGTPETPFRSTLPDERVRHFLLDRGFRATTVPALAPNGRFGDHRSALEAFETSRRELRAYLRDLPPALRHHGFESPVSSQKIDGYQMLTFIIAHGDRHAEQIEETLERLALAAQATSGSA